MPDNVYFDLTRTFNARGPIVALVRAIGAGAQVQDVQTVSSLWNQFDSNHATPWFTLRLPVTVPGDTVEVTLTAANAVDNAYLGLLYADIVQETVHEISDIDLRDLIHDPDQYAASRRLKPLTMLSSSATVPNLVSYDGFVRIHGTIRISGPASDSVQNIWIDVLQDGIVRATGQLARASVSPVRAALLNRPFGVAGSLSLTESTGGITPLLFEIPSAELANLNQTDEDNHLRLQIRAQFASGALIAPQRMERDLVKLVLFTRTNRFGANRDAADCDGLSSNARLHRNRPPFPCGGDSWLRPKLKKWIESVTDVRWQQEASPVNWNDFSNMHGGHFPIHAEHLVGTQADGLYDGYVDMDEAAARKMIDFLARYGAAVERVFVGYNTISRDGVACAVAVPVVATDDTNVYWNVIRSSPRLPNGVLPRAVIRNASGHCDHFDVLVDLARVQ